jgi:uncharacterized membrane protein
VAGRERPRHLNVCLVVVGLVIILVGVSAIFLWTGFHHVILVVVAMLCIFIGLVLVAAGAGAKWFPMMGVEKWRTSQSDLTK